MNIPVRIHTNVDEGRVREWPKRLWAKPEVGEHIRSLGGNVELKISSIVHTENGLDIELTFTDSMLYRMRLEKGQ